MTSRQYRLQIQDRDYTSWSFVDPETSTPKQLTESESIINPAILKLFSDDIIDLSTPIPVVRHSPTKSTQIPGVLILDGNKTYGRTTNAKRLLYKCVPNNPKLPAFLVPYQPDINFAKTQKNRYVVFRFDNWNTKYPQGILTENLGDVDNMTAFYEYQLFCRDISYSIAEFTAAAKNTIQTSPATLAQQFPIFFHEAAQPPPTKNQKIRVFSIDPEGAKDFDDAFSIFQDSPFTVKIRIYIANVFAWMEILNLWTAFGERVSTIYLPGSRRSMLPTILSESICSLVADKTAKPTVCMEFRVRTGVSNNITSYSQPPLIIPESVRFFNIAVKIDRNYVYESKSLLADSDYQLLLRCTRMFDSDIRDSRDVVSHWMVYMNTVCGNYLYRNISQQNSFRGGIFREVSINKAEDPEPPLQELPMTTRTLIKNWKNTTGKYVDYGSVSDAPELYVHITSPIRRLVDILNQIVFQKEFGLVETVSREAEEFLEKWRFKLPEINRQMKAARKVQIDCDLLYRCNAHPEWMQHHHRGVIFDRVELSHKTDLQCVPPSHLSSNSDGGYSYMVHLSDLNILGRIVSQEKYVNYQVLNFRLFLFQDADKLNRKIRLVVV
jgi:hypothetical protein